MPIAANANLHHWVKQHNRPHREESMPVPPDKCDLPGFPGVTAEQPKVYSRKLWLVSENDRRIKPKFLSTHPQVLFKLTEKVVNKLATNHDALHMALAELYNNASDREKGKSNFLALEAEQILTHEGYGKYVWGVAPETQALLGNAEQSNPNLDPVLEAELKPKWSTFDEAGVLTPNDYEEITLNLRHWMAARIHAKINAPSKKTPVRASAKKARGRRGQLSTPPSSQQRARANGSRTDRMVVGSVAPGAAANGGHDPMEFVQTPQRSRNGALIRPSARVRAQQNRDQVSTPSRLREGTNLGQADHLWADIFSPVREIAAARGDDSIEDIQAPQQPPNDATIAFPMGEEAASDLVDPTELFLTLQQPASDVPHSSGDSLYGSDRDPDRSGPPVPSTEPTTPDTAYHSDADTVSQQVHREATAMRFGQSPPTARPTRALIKNQRKLKRCLERVITSSPPNYNLVLQELKQSVQGAYEESAYYKQENELYLEFEELGRAFDYWTTLIDELVTKRAGFNGVPCMSFFTSDYLYEDRLRGLQHLRELRLWRKEKADTTNCNGEFDVDILVIDIATMIEGLQGTEHRSYPPEELVRHLKTFNRPLFECFGFTAR
ncbi:uncharacterized protein K460DRAFT_407533 [Cucurbitaria berberidis CBS 394.84]|uniref:Uncharacterized protein n=1 Tax=Cucurbitaria berberidis CBS 394.84 TaxID=1168544 RepID=A0A9P4GC58_9PLEO|nr:uncharacterized protein K460DRAFT_407533 [Cucurbitaria berberidis CBS 394.84]KAF1843168.1 hypothetical protein K460DRAFT_407533 [Cucurbitaria berberidis CBS 394.84]